MQKNKSTYSRNHYWLFVLTVAAYFSPLLLPFAQRLREASFGRARKRSCLRAALQRSKVGGARWGPARRLWLILLLAGGGIGSEALAQTDEQKLVREGNKMYDENKFTDAEKNYLNALGKRPNSYRAAFNLGDTYYKQGKYKEASEQFEILSTRKAGDDTLSKVYHNLGNSYLKQKEFEKSVSAYKNALKKNMSDEETRYNLAYAQKMLKQQQQKQKQDKNRQAK